MKAPEAFYLLTDFPDTINPEFSEPFIRPLTKLCLIVEAKPKHSRQFISKKLSEWMTEGRDLVSLNSYSKALAAFEKACLIAPDDANAQAERANAAGWVKASRIVSIKKAQVPAESKAFFNTEVTVNDLINADKAGIIWEARHTLSVNKYIMQSVPSYPPIEHFEIYELWPQFLYSRLEYKCYPTFKIVANRFIKWLKEILRNAGTKDLRNTWALDGKIKKEGIEVYTLAMELYSKKQNQDKSTL